MSCNKVQANNFNIHVDLSNLTLTPFTCATLLSRIIKYLIFEKSQIPYPYEQLKTIINKKRNVENDEEDEKQRNIQAERHYRTVSGAYDKIELLLKQIRNHFNEGNKVEEILLLFGGSELNPKQVYRIRIPNLAFGHYEPNHIREIEKRTTNILRQIVLSEEWTNAANYDLTPTNMFVFLKTRGDNLQVQEYLIPNSSFYFPKKVLMVDVLLNYVHKSTNCCSLQVYSDTERKTLSNNGSSNEKIMTENAHSKTEWYQVDVTFKGFKEGYVNKIPLSQLW